MSAAKLRTKPMPDRAQSSMEGERCCVVCYRDIKQDKTAREIHIIGGGGTILHPADESEYEADSGDLGLHLIGQKCARRLGLKWSTPEGADAKCTGCGAMYLSGEGPPQHGDLRGVLGSNMTIDELYARLSGVTAAAGLKVGMTRRHDQ